MWLALQLQFHLLSCTSSLNLGTPNSYTLGINSNKKRHERAPVANGATNPKTDKHLENFASKEHSKITSHPPNSQLLSPTHTLSIVLFPNKTTVLFLHKTTVPSENLFYVWN